MFHPQTVPDVACLPEQLSRLAATTFICPRSGGPTPPGPDQAILARKRGVYGYRKIRDALREMGETCGKHRVARLMRHEGLGSQTGYRHCPGHYGGCPESFGTSVRCDRAQ